MLKRYINGEWIDVADMKRGTEKVIRGKFWWEGHQKWYEFYRGFPFFVVNSNNNWTMINYENDFILYTELMENREYKTQLFTDYVCTDPLIQFDVQVMSTPSPMISTYFPAKFLEGYVYGQKEDDTFVSMQIDFNIDDVGSSGCSGLYQARMTGSYKRLWLEFKYPNLAQSESSPFWHTTLTLMIENFRIDGKNYWFS